MKGKLIRSRDGSKNVYELLCWDGSLKRLKTRELVDFFTRFRDDRYLSGGEDGRWDETALDLSETGGDMVAYITSAADRQNLVIVDPSPFLVLFKTTADTPRDYISVNEYAEMYGVSKEVVKVYCREGRIPGAYKAGQRQWLIPKEAPYPVDMRVRATRRTVKTPVETI